MFKTIAGKAVGKGLNEIVRYDAETGKSKAYKVNGRYIYIQKCVRPEAEGGIIIPDKSRDNHQDGSHTTCLVLAIGDKCGTPRELTDAQVERCEREPEYKYTMTSVALDVKVYDKVLCPDTNAFHGIINSPWADDEFFILDSLPIAKIEE